MQMDLQIQIKISFIFEYNPKSFLLFFKTIPLFCSKKELYDLNDQICLIMQKRKSQNETIQKLCSNRKQENFQLLKAWDMQRAQKMMIHRKIIDQLDESIQDKLTESSAYIDIVRQFLTDLLTQKIKYELQTVNNPESKIKNNLAGQCVYKHSGKQLGRLYQLTNNYKGYKKLKVILEKGLEKVQKLLVESQREIMEMRTSIEIKVNQLQNNNDLTLEMCGELMAVFNKEKQLKPFLCQRDMYIEEQRFIYQAFVQTETERQLGSLMASYLDYVQQLEKKKLVLIKEVIGSYLDGVKEQHQDEAQLYLLRDILKKQTQHKYIQECYSSDELLSKQIKADIGKLLAKHQKEVSLKLVKYFLKRFQYSYFEHINYLMLKQYQIFMKVGQELQEINAIISVDAYLNIFFRKKLQSVNSNPQQLLLQTVDYSLKLDHTMLMQRDGDINLEIQAKKTNKMLSSPPPTRLVLIFINEDQRQQFFEFAEKIMK